MKHLYNLQCRLWLLLAILGVFSFGASAQTLSNVSAHTQWVFGKSPTITDASYQKAWTWKDGNGNPVDNVPTGNNVSYITENLKAERVSGKGNNAVTQLDNRLHNYKALAFQFQVSGNGTLKIKAQKWNDTNYSDSGASSDAFSFPVTAGNDSYTLNIAENTTEGSVVITAAAGTTITLSPSNKTYSLFYIEWTPADTRPEAPFSIALQTPATGNVIYTNETNRVVVTSSVSDLTYTYASSNTDVIGVDGSGNLTPVSAGTATITVATHGNSTYQPTSKTLNVTVNYPVLAMAIKFQRGDRTVYAKGETNRLYVGATLNDEAVTGLSYNWSSSNTNVITVDGSGNITAKAPGTATITATVDASSRYSGSASVQLYVTPTLTTPAIDVSDLSGDKLQIKPNGTAVDVSGHVTVKKGSTDITSQGSLAYASSSLTVSGTSVSADAARTDGNISAAWTPNYSSSTSLDINNFTTRWNGATDSDGAVTMNTDGGGIGWYFGDNAPATSGRTHAVIALAEPSTTALYVTVTYVTTGLGFQDNREQMYMQYPAGTRYLCMPIAGDKAIYQIHLTSGSYPTTFTIESARFASGDYTPVYGEVNDVVVASSFSAVTPELTASVANGTIYIGNAAPKVPVTTTVSATASYNNAAVTGLTYTYSSSDTGIASVDASTGVVTPVAPGTATITVTSTATAEYNSATAEVKVDVRRHLNQRNTIDPASTPTVTENDVTYYVITVGQEVTVVPVFTLDDGTVVNDLGYDCSTAYGTDDRENIKVGTNSTNRGVVHAYYAGYGDVAVSLKQGHTDTYNKTTQRSHFKVVQAQGVMKTNGKKDPQTTYTGTGLGLTTRNSVDLSGKFRVYLGDKNISDKGAFTYAVTGLTLDGTTVSSATETTNATITVTWTPGGSGNSDPAKDYTLQYSPVTFTVTDVVVVNGLPAPKMTVSPQDITINEGQEYNLIELAVNVTFDGELEGTTFDSSLITMTVGDSQIATISGGKLTAVKGGQTTITVTYPGDGSTYQSVSETVNVTVLKVLTAEISPSSVTSLIQGHAQQFTVTYKYKGETVTGLSTTWSASGYKKGETREYNAGVDITSDGTVTALFAGPAANTASGKAQIYASFAGNDEYAAIKATHSLTINDNTLFDYMGWDLSGGLSGTLSNGLTGNSRVDYIHWRFGAEEKEAVHVFRTVSSGGNTYYRFTTETLTLDTKSHGSEKPIDVFSTTKLTSTGDAFLEYNGMIAGYGTEKGGRYMTPISGTFVRIEAEYDGVVTVRLRHNGAVDNSSYSKDSKTNAISKVRVGRRPLFVIDENGEVMPRTSASTLAAIEGKTYGTDAYNTALKALTGTYARIADNSAVNDRFDVINDAYTPWFADTSSSDAALGNGYDHDFSKNAFHFTRNVIYGADYGDAKAEAFNNDVRNGYSQTLFYSDSDDDVAYQAKDASGNALVDNKTYFFSKYGYEVLGATHLMISFPVKAGKTYFVGANKSKIGMCSVEFTPADSYSATPVTLHEDAEAGSGSTNAWLRNTDDGAKLNVTLDRTFTAGRWHPLVLPFSVSETQLEQVFGEGVAVISLDGAMKMLSSKNNYATRDGDFYDTDDDDDIDGLSFNGSQIKQQAVHRDASGNGAVTFTRHKYQMIYANCPVFLYVKTTKQNPTFNNVTFQRYTLDKGDAAGTDAIGEDYMVTFPYAVDRQIGDGDEYDYVMKASYVKTTPDNDAYYLTNVGSGLNGTTAYLYHATAGTAPEMKGMRVWIEPRTSRATAPIRSIEMRHFYGDELDQDIATGIADIVCDEPIETGSRYLDENVYDISGRVVGHGGTDGLAPGLYIHKGRKVYVK